MKNIFITGASSGIGENLAYIFSKPGVSIGISARRLTELNRVAKKCEELGARIYIYNCDVKNQIEMRNAILDFTSKVDSLDCVIANSGIGNAENILSGDATNINEVITTNFLGVTNTLLPAMPIMKKQNFGKLVAISSVASYIRTPNNSGYSASKAGVRMLMDGFRIKLLNYNINCITICPGFIDTPIVNKSRSTPLILPVEIGTKKIVNAILKNKKNFIFPWQFHFLLPLIKIIPDKILQKFVK